MPTEPTERGSLAGVRLAVATALGFATLAGAVLAGGSWAVAVSGGWCALALVVLVWVWATIGRKDADATARHARAEDFSRTAADGILVSASVASLVAVAFTLVQAGHAHGAAKALLIALVS